MSRLRGFLLGSHPDDRGRMLSDIVQRDDAWLEATHDFIQWLFPLTERSGASPSAPTLDEATIAELHDDPEARRNLRASLDRMLAFYGLSRAGDRIVKAQNWGARKHNWFVHDTHNNLRITRILRSLSLLGLHDEAQAFWRALTLLRQTEPDCGIGASAWRYWADAVPSEPLRLRAAPQIT